MSKRLNVRIFNAAEALVDFVNENKIRKIDIQAITETKYSSYLYWWSE